MRAPKARGALRASVLLAGLLVAAGTAAWGAPPDGVGPTGQADSLRLVPPISVHGGRLLSTGEIRRRLSPPREDSVLSRAEIEQALASLGEKLVAAGYLEAELALEARAGERSALTVREGPPARWDSVTVRVVPRADSLAARSRGGFPGPRGIPIRVAFPSGGFDRDRFERLLWDWIDLWTENGHPFASADLESLRVEHGDVRASVRFDPGPRLRVAEVTFPGRTGTRDSFLRRWIRFRRGALYRESEWAARLRRLEQSGLFAGVEDPRLEVGSDGLHIAMPVEESKHNQLDGAVGYSGLTRTVSGFADVELGDLFGTGRSAGFRWERLQKSQSRLRLNYAEPLLGPFPVGLQASLQQEVQDSTYSLAVWEATVQAMIGWDLTASVGLEYRRSVVGPEPSELTRRLSSVFGGSWNTIRPQEFRGGRLTASFRSGQSRLRPQGGGPIQTSRLNRGALEVERYWRLGGSLVLRGHGGASALSRSDSLPLTEALKIGGAGSVRGYSEEQIATLRYVYGQVEFGVALPGARAYVFSDGAWFRDFAPPFRDRDAAGFGVGMISENPGREVGVDLGIPRGGTLKEGRLHIRLQTRF